MVTTYVRSETCKSQSSLLSTNLFINNADLITLQITMWLKCIRGTIMELFFQLKINDRNVISVVSYPSLFQTDTNMW